MIPGARRSCHHAPRSVQAAPQSLLGSPVASRGEVTDDVGHGDHRGRCQAEERSPVAAQIALVTLPAEVAHAVALWVMAGPENPGHH